MFNFKVRIDKVRHFMVFGIIGCALFGGLGMAGYLIAAAICASKEIIWDKMMGKGTPELMDFVAGMIAPTVMLILSFIIWGNFAAPYTNW